jgi:hypothetical protein
MERNLSELNKKRKKRRFVVGPPVPGRPLSKKKSEKKNCSAHLLLPAS